jgi:hypothetical protein
LENLRHVGHCVLRDDGIYQRRPEEVLLHRVSREAVRADGAFLPSFLPETGAYCSHSRNMVEICEAGRVARQEQIGRLT